MIYTKGQNLTIPVTATVIAPFAHEDHIYYICKPVNSYADTLWIVNSDSAPINITTELLEKASKVIS